MFSFRTFPSTPRKQVWQFYPVYFARSQSMVKIWKLFHSVYFFPRNVTLEMMNANLATLPISFEVAKEFHIMCGNDKKLSFSPRGSTFQHFSTGHVKAVWASCQTFFAQNQKQVTFVKVFKKLFSSKSFSGRVKFIFDRLVETTFAKRYTTLLLKVRNW